MSASTPAIRGVKARAVIAPISRPVKNAFGVIEAAPLVTELLADAPGLGILATSREWLGTAGEQTLRVPPAFEALDPAPWKPRKR